MKRVICGRSLSLAAALTLAVAVCVQPLIAQSGPDNTS